MKIVKQYMKSPYIILILFSIKLAVYYSLINVDLMKNFAVMGSVIILAGLFLGFGCSKLKYRKLLFLSCYIFVSVIMFADTMYFNYYNQTVSIRQIWQASNVAAVPSSFIATLIPASFIILLDIPFVFFYFTVISDGAHVIMSDKKLKYLLTAISGLLILYSVNPLGSAAIERVNSVEFFSNHFNDIYKTLTAKVNAKEIPKEEVLETVHDISSEAKIQRFEGVGEGKNLIVIQMESFQNFLLNAEYNGQVITPILNQLLKENSLYYSNYYANIGKGNTADAEFSTLNSLYPDIEGESYRLFTDNTYHGLPWIMREKGYSSFAVHGYEEEFWNRKSAYPNQGFEDYISMEDMDSSEKIGLGVSDKSMFEQLMPVIKNRSEDGPFFSFVITLTNHHPYIIDEKDASLKLMAEDADTKFGAYLQTARYTDEAIGQFIIGLKEEGLYENTVIALYGDHHGMNCKMKENREPMEKFLGRPYDFDEMFHIPLIIHVPGLNESAAIQTVGGQVDFLPTISNIMGAELNQPYIMGQDLTNAEEGFVAFTAYLFEGSFAKNNVMFEISREGVFENSRAWEIGTGKELDYTLFKEDYERALKLKETSKGILVQDLIKEEISH